MSIKYTEQFQQEIKNRKKQASYRFLNYKKKPEKYSLKYFFLAICVIVVVSSIYNLNFFVDKNQNFKHEQALPFPENGQI